MAMQLSSEEGHSQWNQGVGRDSVISVDETLGDISEVAEQTHSDGVAEVEGHIAEGTRGRKRKRQPEHWKRHVRQKARSSGLPHVPKVLPHYCRKNTQKQYLSPELNIKQTYRLYRDDYCVCMKISPVKEHKYRHVFTHEFNLRCFPPNKDQCSLCNSYYEATGEDPLLAKKLEDHKQRKKESMEEKANDEQRASKDNTFAAVSFDLEAVLVTPHAGDAQIYYKCKLAVYNFTLYETASHQGYCYVWDEMEGGRGSNEIASALMDYLKNLLPTITHVATFSDTCSGQNRNVYIAAAMLFAIQTIPNLHVVDMKFMECGHSYLEADSMHAALLLYSRFL